MAVATATQATPEVLRYNQAISLGSWKKALAAIPVMFSARVSPDTVSYNSCISSCGRATTWDRALDIVRACCRSSTRLNTVTFNASMQACVNQHIWALAIMKLQELRQRDLNYDPVTCTTSICNYAEAALWAKAWRSLSHMPENSLQVSVLAEGAVLTACEKEKQWRQALGVQDWSFQAGLKMNTVVGNIMSCVHRAHMLWWRSLFVLHGFQLQNLEPDVIAFSSCTRACSDALAWETAAIFLQLLGGCGILADTLMCNSQISSCGSWPAGLLLLAQMPLSSVRCSTASHNSCVDISAKSSAWPRAFMQVNELHVRGLHPDLITLTTTMAVTAAIETRESEWQRALALALPDRQERPITALIISQRWHDALRMLLSLICLGTRPGRSIIAQNAAISACEREGAWEFASRLLRWPTGDNMLGDTFAHSAALTACARAIQWAHAAVLTSQITAEWLQPNEVTLNALLSTCDRAVLWLGAFQCLQQFHHMRQLPDRITYNTTLSACAKSARWRKATHLLHELYHTSLQATLITYNSAWKAYSKSLQWRHALALWCRIQNSVQPNSVSYEAILASFQSHWRLAWFFLSRSRLASAEFAAAPYEHIMSACFMACQWCKLPPLTETVLHETLLLLGSHRRRDGLACKNEGEVPSLTCLHCSHVG